MSTTTSNLHLFKYDSTDHNAAFDYNIALNDNWDKIDTNFGRVIQNPNDSLEAPILLGNSLSESAKIDVASSTDLNISVNTGIGKLTLKPGNTSSNNPRINLLPQSDSLAGNIIFLNDSKLIIKGIESADNETVTGEGSSFNISPYESSFGGNYTFTTSNSTAINCTASSFCIQRSGAASGTVFLSQNNATTLASKGSVIIKPDSSNGDKNITFNPTGLISVSIEPTISSNYNTPTLATTKYVTNSLYKQCFLITDNSGTIPLSPNYSLYRIIPQANTTVTIDVTNADLEANYTHTFELWIRMPTLYTISWGTTIKWENNTAPSLATTGNYYFVFRTVNAGASWIGSCQGMWG